MAPMHLLVLFYQQSQQRIMGNYNGFYFLNIDEGYYTKDTNEFQTYILPHQYLFFSWLLYNFYIFAKLFLLPLSINSLGKGIAMRSANHAYLLQRLLFPLYLTYILYQKFFKFSNYLLAICLIRRSTCCAASFIARKESSRQSDILSR